MLQDLDSSYLFTLFTLAHISVVTVSAIFLSIAMQVGDFAYADDRFESSYETTWNSWLNQVQPIAANLPYMVLPGNHVRALLSMILY